MAIRKTISVSIGSELLAFAESLRTSGRYGGLSEVVRTALRHLEERELDVQAHRDKRALHPSDAVGHQVSERDRDASHV